jgi:hypothetical protein
MTVLACVVVLICMTVASGCSSGKAPATHAESQVSSSPIQSPPQATDKERLALTGERVLLTKENLR